MVDHEPTAAERARTILATATSLTVTAGPLRAHLAGPPRYDAAGRLTIEVPDGSELWGTRGSPGVVEVTDVAPVAMRERVRGRLAMAGWLAPAAGGPGRVVAFAPVAARLMEGLTGRVTALSGGALAAAAPDPLAGTEADMLCHLAGVHRDVVDRLARLIPAAHLQGVCAVLPLRLDRCGLVLRLQYAGDRQRDVRLPFGAPLRTAADAPDRMRELLAAATHRCRHHHR